MSKLRIIAATGAHAYPSDGGVSINGVEAASAANRMHADAERCAREWAAAGRNLRVMPKVTLTLTGGKTETIDVADQKEFYDLRNRKRGIRLRLAPGLARLHQPCGHRADSPVSGLVEPNSRSAHSPQNTTSSMLSRLAGVPQACSREFPTSAGGRWPFSLSLSLVRLPGWGPRVRSCLSKA
jgi:hypothetical protein